MVYFFSLLISIIAYLVLSFQNPVNFPSYKLGQSLVMSSIVDKQFVKLYGLGNDFIIIDNRKQSVPKYTPEQAIKICNRNFGIGGDGLIFVLPGENGCDYTMRIYNSDGSEPQMCGNGIRCLAKYVQELEGKNNNEISYNIWTNAGKMVSKISADGLITIDMGAPILESVKIPTQLNATREGSYVVDSILSIDLPTSEKIEFLTTCVSMGNPHAVIFMEDIENMNPPFLTIGPLVEKAPQFPEKVNAHFVQVISRSHLKMKVWERGAGPTLACGTGACAVVVAAVLTDKAERNCKVSLPGGDLFIRWSEVDNKVYMTGPAEFAFRGTIDIKNL